ncbi:MAG: Endoribonuclease [Myxococcaceae bacterium]|jgi:2-iminobutanoate/2-iminopropanoate deaminase|nr:Endoribonuclease [Myxococcaceae bacterium]MEA2747566.1 2-iminobutanoate/2-iminopropanoate deaminase [Myxococcales bacterium]
MKAISTADAPAAIGPYSQAIHAGDLVFLSGQVPIDPKTGELVTGDIAVQTERVLDNLGAVLAAAGCAFGDVVKTTIYLVDLGDFQAVNQTYAKRFTSAPPARATVQVSALPKGARVEIDAIARVK